MAKEVRYKFLFWAMAAHGDGVSGGDRIFIEFARNWSKDYPVLIYVGKQGLQMAERLNLTDPVKFKILGRDKIFNFNFLLFYLSRIFSATFESLTNFNQIINNRPQITITYSTSDFLMDILPCLILKLRFPKIIWLASWYQTAPNPFQGYSDGKRKNRYRLNALLIWLSQIITKPLINHFSDLVLVNNDIERKVFPTHNLENRVWPVFGGVNVEMINQWKKMDKQFVKIYDAVFQGRFHPQKGILELIDIWKQVVKEKPQAKLALIGDGPLMVAVKTKIAKLKLENNIKLFGYVYDGPDKYAIFSQSKIVLHPAFYDSGGMASAEAMAFGLPCVGFNLKSYESYYPKGMIKVELNNLPAFSKEIIKFLDDAKYLKSLGKEAEEMVNQNWSWSNRSATTLNRIKQFIS